MSNVNEQIEEPAANPYNSRKEWHTPDAPSRGKADGLFFEEAPQEITTEVTPKESKKDTIVVLQKEQPKVIIKKAKPKPTQTEKRKKEFDW